MEHFLASTCSRVTFSNCGGGIVGLDLCSASLNVLQTRLMSASLTHLFLLSLEQLGLALFIGHLEGIIPLLQQQVTLLQVPAQSPESLVTEQKNQPDSRRELQVVHFNSSNSP